MNTQFRAETVDRILKEYRGREFAWGRADCVRAARRLLVALGAKGLPRMTDIRYSSERTALRRLKEQGHDSLESLLSTYCTEIPVAWALPGDLGTIRGDSSLSAITVCAGPAWLGWTAESPDFSVLTLTPERVFRLAETDKERAYTQAMREAARV
ncbi:MAG: hypothetical protein WBF53_07055 [Litorimonas sp.]